MGNELQSLNERIAERVGDGLVDLIPPEQWQKIIDAEVAKFTQTILPKVVQDLLMEEYKLRAQTIITTLPTSQGWDAQTNEQIYEELEKFIGKSSGVIVASMLGPSMQMVLQDLKSRMY